MMYGFIDESGASGKATKPNDYLAASLVVCSSMNSVEQNEAKMREHRKKNGLPPDYEFHCSSNSVKQQEKFVQLLKDLDFRFVTVAVKKDSFKKTATYQVIARELIQAVADFQNPIHIKMDSNPSFYKVLKREIKLQKVQKVKIREAKSKSVELLQVVDYVVNISVKKLKGKKNGHKWYPLIKNKRID